MILTTITDCAVCLAVLVRHGNWVDQYQVSMAGRTTQEQAAKMSQLAGQALQAWKVEGHPGWSVDTMDSHHLCRLDQQQVPACDDPSVSSPVPSLPCMPQVSSSRCMWWLAGCLSVRPSVRPSVRLSVCLSACLSACLPACLSV